MGRAFGPHGTRGCGRRWGPSPGSRREGPMATTNATPLNGLSPPFSHLKVLFPGLPGIQRSYCDGLTPGDRDQVRAAFPPS